MARSRASKSNEGAPAVESPASVDPLDAIDPLADLPEEAEAEAEAEEIAPGENAAPVAALPRRFEVKHPYSPTKVIVAEHPDEVWPAYMAACGMIGSEHTPRITELPPEE